MEWEHRASAGLDVTKPNVARMYDFYLGGKDNFEADREAAREILELAPFTPDLALANRGFLRRATRLMVAAGVRQFLDVGTGLPTRDNVHQVAQDMAPGSRVLYLDNDPIVVSHGRALIGCDDATLVLEHDLREPAAILGDPRVRGFLDMEEPVGLMLLSVLHCLSDEEGVYASVAALLGALTPGSFLAISHVTGDDRLTGCTAAVYDKANTRMSHRTPEQIHGFFQGCTLVEPGLIRPDRWRPDGSTPKVGTGGGYFLCGVGRKDAPTT